MNKHDERQILNIIKFLPPIIILSVSFLVTLLIYNDYKKTLNEEKEYIKKTHLENKKNIIKKNALTAHEFIQSKYNLKEQNLKENLKKQVTIAKTIMQSIYNKYKDTKTKEEITSLIKIALKDIRFFDKRGYYFINQMDGIRVFHPIFPNKEGEDISNVKDKNGEVRFLKVKNVIKEKKAGFTTIYFYSPLDKKTQMEKLVYLEYFEPYDWMIGTGEYLNAFEESVKKDVLSDISKIKLKTSTDYVLLNYDGTFLLHSNKNLNMKNLKKDLQNQNLKKLFSEVRYNLINKTNKKYFTNQKAYNPKTKAFSKKLFYVKTFPKWRWVITTGFYLDEIEEYIKQQEESLEQKYTKYFNTIILSSLLTTFVLLIISFYVARILEKRFYSYKQKLEKKVLENIKQKKILQKAQKVAKIGSWEMDTKTKKIIWSKEIPKIMGLNYQPREVNFDFLKKIIFKEDWEEFYNAIQNTINSNEEYKVIFRVFKEDKSIGWVECRGQIDKQSRIVNGIAQDISENKNLELEKKQQEEIIYQQSKLAAMGEMIGNIAHQWRQPLSSITVVTSALQLQKELGILKESDINEAIETINERAIYLSETIDDFRNFYQTDKAAIYFNTDSLFNKTIKLLNAQFLNKEIQIIKNIKNTPLYTLENELIQVIINILNNARDALIEIKTEKIILIDTYEKNEKVYIEILDNAGGIKEEIINRIFEPYFTTKHQSQGTGIGLYMSEEIVVKHLSGRILVENKEFQYDNISYKGAKFTIILDKSS